MGTVVPGMWPHGQCPSAGCCASRDGRGGGGGLGDTSGAAGRGLSSPSFKKRVSFVVALVLCMYEMAASSFWLDSSSAVSVGRRSRRVVTFPGWGLGGAPSPALLQIRPDLI